MQLGFGAAADPNSESDLLRLEINVVLHDELKGAGLLR